MIQSSLFKISNFGDFTSLMNLVFNNLLFLQSNIFGVHIVYQIFIGIK